MNKLGSMLYRFYIEDEDENNLKRAFLWVRSLSVIEYVDVSAKYLSNPFDKESSEMYIDIAKSCIVGWENFIDDDNNLVEYDPDILFKDQSNYHLICEVGRYCYNLSFPSEEEEDKYRGYVRFLYYLSDDKNVSARNDFDCSYCIDNGRWMSKKCGYTKEQRDMIAKSGSNTEEHSDLVSGAKSKYSSKKKGVKKKVKESGLMLEGFKFPECPVSWLRRDQRELADRLLRASQANQLFFDGSVSSQPNNIYEIQKIVHSESKVIEYDRQVAEMDKK